MSDIVKQLELPLDEDGFLRRECKFCKSQFKIHIKSDYLENQAKELLDTFLKDTDTSTDLEEKSQDEYYCPYCGQSNLTSELWTNEQINYIHIFAKNIANDLINTELIRKLQKSSPNNGYLKIEFTGKELPFIEPWISPEENDMNIFYLPCCDEKIKVNIHEIKKKYFCFYCGFEHK